MKEAVTICLMAGSLILNVAASRMIVKALLDRKRKGFWLGWTLFCISLCVVLFAIYQ